MTERIIEVTGVEGFNSIFDQIKQENPVMMFSATKKENGDPWCPDCRDADPVVESQAAELDSKVKLIRVRVDRPYWKEATENMFKSEHNVKCLPTLMRWGQEERLGEEECKNSSSVCEFLKRQKVEG